MLHARGTRGDEGGQGQSQQSETREAVPSPRLVEESPRSPHSQPRPDAGGADGEPVSAEQSSLYSLDAVTIYRLVNLARKSVNMPICALAVDTPEGVYLRATRNMPVRFIPRPSSGTLLVQTKVRRKWPVIIGDASKDPRFCQDPLVIGPPFVKQCVCVGLFSSKSASVGTLCLMSPTPSDAFSVSHCEKLVEITDKITAEYSKLTSVEEGWRSSLQVATTVSSVESLGSIDAGAASESESDASSVRSTEVCERAEEAREAT